MAGTEETEITAGVLHFDATTGLLRLKVNGDENRRDLKERLDKGEPVTITIQQK